MNNYVTFLVTFTIFVINYKSITITYLCISFNHYPSITNNRTEYPTEVTNFIRKQKNDIPHSDKNLQTNALQRQERRYQINQLETTHLSHCVNICNSFDPRSSNTRVVKMKLKLLTGCVLVVFLAGAMAATDVFFSSCGERGFTCIKGPDNNFNIYFQCNGITAQVCIL